MQQVAQAAGAFGEGSEDECTVRHALRAGRRQRHRLARYAARRAYLDRRREHARDHGVRHGAGPLLGGRADARQEHNLLGRAGVFLVDAHNVQQTRRGDGLRLRQRGDARIFERDGQSIVRQRPHEPPDHDLR